MQRIANSLEPSRTSASYGEGAGHAAAARQEGPGRRTCPAGYAVAGETAAGTPYPIRGADLRGGGRARLSRALRRPTTAAPPPHPCPRTAGSAGRRCRRSGPASMPLSRASARCWNWPPAAASRRSRCGTARCKSGRPGASDQAAAARRSTGRAKLPAAALGVPTLAIWERHPASLVPLPCLRMSAQNDCRVHCIRGVSMLSIAAGATTSHVESI